MEEKVDKLVERLVVAVVEAKVQARKVDIVVVAIALRVMIGAAACFQACLVQKACPSNYPCWLFSTHTEHVPHSLELQAYGTCWINHGQAYAVHSLVAFGILL